MMLSIIISVSDNFDMGDNLAEQLEITLQNIFTFSKHEQLDLEVIIVNWNVISEKHTYNLLDISNKPDSVQLHYIEIDNTLHNTYNLSNKIPFYIGHAINIGIRKAQSDAILKMTAGTFFNEKIWRNIKEYISDIAYKNTLLTLALHLEFDKEILKNSSNNYFFEENNFQNLCVKKLKDDKIIDYSKKRIYINKNNLLKEFDALLFSKTQAEKVQGFPELSLYPGLLTDKIFVENILKYTNEHKIWSAGNKIFYETREHLNPMEDNELKLAPDTDNIIINRIQKEYNPVLFNNDNWGLQDIVLDKKG